jgi:hypothetical protein
VPRWFENLRIENSSGLDSDGNRLLGEVNHATGNLVHRMYYWTAILEEEPGSENAGEAVESLKSSLGELHRLVNRAFELMRPVEARPIPVAASDLAQSIAMRLGVNLADPDDFLSDPASAAAEVQIDPVQLDKAVGMLRETLDSVSEDNGLSPLEIRPMHRNGRRRLERDGFVLRCRIYRDEVVGEPRDSTVQDVAIALATKLLSVFDWVVEVEDVRDERRFVIFVPMTKQPAVQAEPAEAAAPA